MKITVVPSQPFLVGALALACAFALGGCQTGPVSSADQTATAANVPAAVTTPLAVAAVTHRAPPIEVVSLSGRNVVLNQGAAAVDAGTLYQAVLVDAGAASDTSGTPCCSIQVDRVSANEAYGHIVDADFRKPGKFVPGSIELRGPVPLQSVVAVTAKMVATN